MTDVERLTEFWHTMPGKVPVEAADVLERLDVVVRLRAENSQLREAAMRVVKTYRLLPERSWPAGLVALRDVLADSALGGSQAKGSE